MEHENDGDTYCNRLVKGLEEYEIKTQVETIQKTARLRSARILRIVLEACCLSNSSELPSADAGVKNSQRSKIIINIKWKKKNSKWLNSSIWHLIGINNPGQRWSGNYVNKEVLHILQGWILVIRTLNGWGESFPSMPQSLGWDSQTELDTKFRKFCKKNWK